MYFDGNYNPTDHLGSFLYHELGSRGGIGGVSQMVDGDETAFADTVILVADYQAFALGAGNCSWVSGITEGHHWVDFGHCLCRQWVGSAAKN